MPKHKQEGETNRWRETGRQSEKKKKKQAENKRKWEGGRALLMALVSDLFWRSGSRRRQEGSADDFFAPSSPFPDYERRHGARSRVKPKGDSIVLKLSRTATYFDMHRPVCCLSNMQIGEPGLSYKGRQICAGRENERPPVTKRMGSDGQAFSQPTRHFPSPAIHTSAEDPPQRPPPPHSRSYPPRTHIHVKNLFLIFTSRKWGEINIYGGKGLEGGRRGDFNLLDA